MGGRNLLPQAEFQESGIYDKLLPLGRGGRSERDAEPYNTGDLISSIQVTKGSPGKEAHRVVMCENELRP